MTMQLAAITCCFCLGLYATWTNSVAAQCRLRNTTDAGTVGRPCRKNCASADNEPIPSKCKGQKVCKCDHECGYSCIKPDAHCPRLPEIPFMRYVDMTKEVDNETRDVYPPYEYNDRAVYVCQPGYKLRNPIMHWCHGRRGWTHGSSECVRACLPKDTIEINRYSLTCGPPCVADRDCGANEECLCDGSCGRSCVNSTVDCGEAPSVDNARIEYTGQGFNRVAHYICEEGFYLAAGKASRKCTGGGTYDEALPECLPVECGNPRPAIEETDGWIANPVRPPHYFGQQITFMCPPSHRMIGSLNRTCQSNGQWSGENTVCDLIDGNFNRCPNPGVPINGVVIHGYNYNVEQIVEFACHPGYVMIGEATQECLYFLQWSGGGAPKCIDPRYSDTQADVLAKLQASNDRFKSKSVPQVGRFISASHQAGHEIYFLIDLSKSVTQPELNNSLTFCVKLIERLQANATGRIKYGVMVFASEVKVLLNTGDIQPSAAEVKQIIKSINDDRANLKEEILSGTATYKALDELRNQLALSYDAAEKNGTDDTEYHVFVVTDGRHTEGKPPQEVVDNLVKQQFPDNPPEFYSITSCTDCKNFENSDAYTELLGLALNKPENFIKIDDFHSIISLLDKVTDARIDYSACGVAGDIGSVKYQAARKVGRVLGGIKAADRSWPWQLVISTYGANLVQVYGNNLKGGGTLINNKWVLTAAHLFSDIEEDAGWEQNILLTFGMHTRPSKKTDVLSNIVRVYRADKIKIPDDFDSLTYHNDVALIRIGSQLQFNRGWKEVEDSGFLNFTAYIRPVCLPCMDNNCVGDLLRKERNGVAVLSGNETEEERCRIESQWLANKEDDNIRVLAVVTGFGHVNKTAAGGKTKPSLFLKQGLLRLRSNEHCNRSTNDIPARIPFTNTMSCATSGLRDRSVDACQGDSGGPVVREVLDEETKKSCWVQLGIVSWGWGCGQTYVKDKLEVQYPGYHTDVVSVIQWIKDTMAADENVV